MDSFPCTKCGLCCKYIGYFFENKESVFESAYLSYIDNFPYKIKEDNSCEMLSDDGLCTVYHDRPLICNVSLMAETLNLNITDYYLKSAKNCNELITLANLNPDYLINLEQLMNIE